MNHGNVLNTIEIFNKLRNKIETSEYKDRINITLLYHVLKYL